MPGMSSADPIHLIGGSSSKRDLTELKAAITLRAIELMQDNDWLDPWAAFIQAQMEQDKGGSLVTRAELNEVRQEIDGFLSSQRDEVIIRAEKRFLRSGTKTG